MISLWLLKLMFNPYCLIPPIIKLSLLIKIDWLCFVFGSGPILLTYTESALINEYFSIFNIYPDSGVRSFCAPVLMVWRPKIFLVRRLNLDCNVFFLFFILFSWLKSFFDSNLAMWYHTSWVFPTINQIFLFTRTTRPGHLRRVPMLTNKIKLGSFLLI